MDKLIENLLTEFVTRAEEKFNLSFEDALAAASQTKVANNLFVKLLIGSFCPTWHNDGSDDEI